MKQCSKQDMRAYFKRFFENGNDVRCENCGQIFDNELQFYDHIPSANSNVEKLKEELYEKFVMKYPRSLEVDDPSFKSGVEIEEVWEWIEANFVSKERAEKLINNAYDKGMDLVVEMVRNEKEIFTRQDPRVYTNQEKKDKEDLKSQFNS